VLQARHLEHKPNTNNSQSLSLYKLYEVFRKVRLTFRRRIVFFLGVLPLHKWTAQSKTDEGTRTIPRPPETETRPATAENGLQQPPTAPQRPLTTADGSRRDTNKRRHHPSSSSEEGVVSASSTIATIVTNDEEEEEETEEEVAYNGHKRRRPVNKSNHERVRLPRAEKDKRPQLRRTRPLKTRRVLWHARGPGRTSATKRLAHKREEEENEDEEEQQDGEEEEEGEETEEGDAAPQRPPPALKNAQKLRAPFHPPQHLRGKPCPLLMAARPGPPSRGTRSISSREGMPGYNRSGNSFLR